MKKYDYYNAIELLSHNAIFNFVITNRNYGKTWAFKKRAFVRGIKKGKKTIWLRRFKNEAKEAVAKMFTSLDLQKFCGIIPYDVKTKEGNFRQEGNRFYCKHNGKWIWFLQVCCISESASLRSADDVDTDTIIYDEFTTTPERYRRFIGNEVENFIDLFISNKREHEIKVIFLGNKESVSNPYFNYFGIKPLKIEYEGIRTLKNGSIAIQQINNRPKDKKTGYDEKLASLLNGTRYGNYLYKDNFKNANIIKKSKAPKDSHLFGQFRFKGKIICIKGCLGKYYINTSIDINKDVYVDSITNQFKNEKMLLKSKKPLFNSFKEAVSNNDVFFENEIAYENAIELFNWLGL